ncbi:MAG: hypothetical protein B7Z78_04560 [Rhodospirillales bacterium 20-60-12]|nr:MAG: hypothetical protein B7Z78_04560 [Rhodospirillales bacterium 20-60-12]HQT67526.1 ShlB/FhaC/HecB family hemolysin secretion/activation protein [Acetobacteraceae bacterium]
MTSWIRFWRSFLFLLAVAAPLSAHAQVGGFHLLGTGELQAPPPPQVSHAPPAAKQAPIAAPRMQAFVLRGIIIDGHSSVPAPQLTASWSHFIGQTVSTADLSTIATRIGTLEGDSDIALYTVSFPPQAIIGGIVHIRITEASVVHIVIAGQTAHQRLGLLKSYAQNIIASRPLRRSVLERNVLLMGDIAGAKVGSQFVPVPGQPDAVQMVLAIKQTKIFGGFSVNNQGQPILDNTQAVFNTGVNDLFHQGERTQLVLGLPLDVTRYQYFGLNDIEPIGTDGMTVSLSLGDLISRPINEPTSGNAELLGLRLNYPILRAVHRNLIISGGFDLLNSDNAYLAFTTSRERTRALRVSLSYNDDQYVEGIDNFGVTVSKGINIFGARPASIAYGGSDFSKLNLNLQRLQALPHGFALKLSALGQFTSDHLPPSEEFDFGGPTYGRAFTAAELTGDEGYAVSGELAHAVPMELLPRMLAGTAVFILADYGRIWNRQAIFQVPTDRAASFAAGIKFHIIDKFVLSIGVATPIVKPLYVPHSEHYRLIIQTAGHF